MNVVHQTNLLKKKYRQETRKLLFFWGGRKNHYDKEFKPKKRKWKINIVKASHKKAKK